MGTNRLINKSLFSQSAFCVISLLHQDATAFLTYARSSEQNPYSIFSKPICCFKCRAPSTVTRSL